MNRKIKLIWEFSGPEAEETAKHHAVVLERVSAKKKIEYSIPGTEYINHVSWLAYLIVLEKNVPVIKDVLKPLRSEIFED
ncbi:MAG: hypothetical protein JKX68_06460 [Flavobacteriales bacterium]|nr:hypothetical protein [Flavobacteriales bacterium]